jgi:hypothetical protein
MFGVVGLGNPRFAFGDDAGIWHDVNGDNTLVLNEFHTL